MDVIGEDEAVGNLKSLMDSEPSISHVESLRFCRIHLDSSLIKLGDVMIYVVLKSICDSMFTIKFHHMRDGLL